MTGNHPSPEDFSKLDELRKNEAYRALFTDFHRKGGRLRRVKQANRTNTENRRRGGKKRHENGKEVLILIKAFWDLARLNSGRLPSMPEIFQVVIDGRRDRESGLTDSRLRDKKRIQTSTATKWRTHLGKAWRKNPSTFKIFLRWARHFSNPRSFPAPNH
jgi:hypothetical protein